MKRLWNVEVMHCGIRLHIDGSTFVYSRTVKRAREVFGRQCGSVWDGTSGHVDLPASCSVGQARELRRLVLSDIEERLRLITIKNILDGLGF